MTNKKLPIYAFLLVSTVAAILFAALNIDRPASWFRECQTASTAKIYAEEGDINLFYPKLNVMGEPGYFVLEFPIYQGILALLWDVFSLHETWGRLLSLFFWVLGAFYLYNLCILFSDRRTALFTFFIFLFAPNAVKYSTCIVIEAMSVCLSIMFLYYGAKWIISNRLLYFFIALVICTVGFVQKLPNMAGMFLPLVALKYVYGKKKISSIFSPLFILLGLIPFVLLLMWQHHADQVNAMHQASEWLGIAKLRSWYFGTVGQRLNPINYLLVFARNVEYSLGSVSAGVLVIIGLLSARKYYFFAFYLLAYLFSFLIFTNLYLPHDYYSLPFLAPIAFWGAVGGIRCWDKLEIALIKLGKIRIKPSQVKTVIIFSAMFIFVLNTVRVTYLRDVFHVDEDKIHLSDIIKDHIPKDSRVMLYQQGQGWNPTIMYLADRRGKTVDLETLEKKEIQKSMRDFGCDYLVLVGKSTTDLYLASKRATSQFRRIIHGKINNRNASDFSVLLTPEIEEKLSSLSAVYKTNRLQIYRR